MKNDKVVNDEGETHYRVPLIQLGWCQSIDIADIKRYYRAA